MGTSSPSLAVQAASLIAPDVAGIDVNAGCPKPFSTTGGMGAALLRTPDLLCSILSALVTEVGTPHQIGISVKIRLLETEEETGALVTALCKTGITGLTVHCRTTPMRPRERAIRHHLRLIASICHAHGVACLMNGDVSSRAEAQTLIQEHNVDGAMIATAAESNPSCFRPASTSEPFPFLPLLPWQTLVKDYLPLCLSTDNKYGNTKFMLNHFIHGKDPVHRRVVQSKSYSEAIEILGLEEFETLAVEVDERLGLGSGHVFTGTRNQEDDPMQREDPSNHNEREKCEEGNVGLSNLETLTTALNELQRDLPRSIPPSPQYQTQQHHQKLQPLSA
jgi:tRNA-dihydrouridine synthase 2